MYLGIGWDVADSPGIYIWDLYLGFGWDLAGCWGCGWIWDLGGTSQKDARRCRLGFGWDVADFIWDLGGTSWEG